MVTDSEAVEAVRGKFKSQIASIPKMIVGMMTTENLIIDAIEMMILGIINTIEKIKIIEITNMKISLENMRILIDPKINLISETAIKALFQSVLDIMILCNRQPLFL